jgi:hypothetical protein
MIFERRNGGACRSGVKQTLSEETGVESSIYDSEIKQYLNEVIKEVQQHKQKT